jgi:hypothetical protein
MTVDLKQKVLEVCGKPTPFSPTIEISGSHISRLISPFGIVPAGVDLLAHIWKNDTEKVGITYFPDDISEVRVMADREVIDFSMAYADARRILLENISTYDLIAEVKARREAPNAE